MNCKFVLLPLLLGLSLSSKTNGQNGWVPPVNLSSNVCDPSGWKLVLSDEFNGTTIDNTKWNTYISWDGMSRVVNGTTIYGDHSDWSGARECNSNALFKDANVVVSGGTCKLLLRNEPYTWQCPSCATPKTKNLTAAVIATPYHLTPNGNSNYYNSGRFEAKIKFPTFKGAWCAFWLWNGAGVDELDMAEAWGGNGFPYIGSRPHDTYNLHAWAPSPNPYSVPNNVSISNTYPNQSWWNFVTGSNLKQDDWHVYTCEWDTASIKTYLDNSLINTIWKYYRTESRTVGIWPFRHTYYYTVGSGCNPAPGLWNVTYGYPYSSTSESQLRLSTGFTDEQQGDANSNYTRGQMEVDYVKAWQKHPEQDGHRDICYVPMPIITGSNIICGSEVYTASNTANLNGTWSVSAWGSALSINSVVNSSNSSSATVSRVSGTPYESAIIQYKFTLPGCPEQISSKTVDVSTANSAIVSCTRAQINSTQEQFSFTAIRPYSLATSGFSPTTYEWDIDYGANYDCTNLLHYHGFGQYVATPYYTNWGWIQDYCVKWTLKITNACGTITKTGQRQYHPLAGRPAYTAFELKGRDIVAAYFQAAIIDSPAYEQAISARVANLMFSEDENNDDVFVNSAIEKIRMEELEPYLLTDSTDSTGQVVRRQIANISNNPETKLYPNPADNRILIEPSTQFTSGQLISINVYDIVGKLVQNQSFIFTQGTPVELNVSGLVEGNYIISLEQSKHVEHLKIVKQNSK